MNNNSDQRRSIDGEHYADTHLRVPWPLVEPLHYSSLPWHSAQSGGSAFPLLLLQLQRALAESWLLANITPATTAILGWPLGHSPEVWHPLHTPLPQMAPDWLLSSNHLSYK